MTLQEQLDEARQEIAFLRGEPDISALIRIGFSMMEARIVAAIANRAEITKEALYAAVYHDREPSMNGLEVLLVRIRRKLKLHNIEIKTMWGSGYTMPSASRVRFREMLGEAA